MKQKRWIIGILVVLAALCTLFAALHLQGKKDLPAGTVRIEENGSVREWTIGNEALQPVTGTVVSGKGETKEINAEGVSLSAIPQEDCKKIAVIAKDEYKAEVQREEFVNAYLILTEEGTVRLIVFGDENAKRDVKEVERIVID